MRVGFIGLGSQGGAMARRIVEAGYETTLWARRPESLEPYGDTAAKTAGSPAELGAASDLACVCVVNDADVREVVDGEQGILRGMKAGGVIAVHSTVHPDTCRELAEKAAAQGIALVDAPVSGGGMGAAAGTLLVMVGGDDDVVARVQPVFETYANPVVHLGGIGAGEVTKLLNNLLFTANLSTASSTMALGEKLGVDPVRLAEVLARGSGNSFALGRITATAGSLDQIAGHAGELLRKDVTLSASLADAAGATVGSVLDAADATLAQMNYPRKES